MANDYVYLKNVIKRMMEDLAEEGYTDDQSPRCDGCGDQMLLAPYELRASDGSVETVMLCEDCRAVADEEW